MITLLLMFVVFISLPTMPGIAGLALLGAAYSASTWKGGYGDALEVIFFYGAIAGCLTVWMR